MELQFHKRSMPQNTILTGSEWTSTFSFQWFIYALDPITITDCKVFPLLVNTSWFSYLGEQCPSEILIAIVIPILACMSVSQLIWWVCASFKLSSACTVLFVFTNCKIRSFSSWLIINPWSDGMLPTNSDLIASYILHNSLHSPPCLEHQLSCLKIQSSQWL